jgi:hypothetical protein
MGYDISLKHRDTGEVVEVPSFIPLPTGGTYAVDNQRLTFYLTYNYAKFFYDKIDAELGIRWIYGKTGAEVIPKLREAADSMSGLPDENYWEATEGNAKEALRGVIRMSELAPDAVWDGD